MHVLKTFRGNKNMFVKIHAYSQSFNTLHVYRQTYLGTFDIVFHTCSIKQINIVSLQNDQ